MSIITQECKPTNRDPSATVTGHKSISIDYCTSRSSLTESSQVVYPPCGDADPMQRQSAGHGLHRSWRAKSWLSELSHLPLSKIKLNAKALGMNWNAQSVYEDHSQKVQFTWNSWRHEVFDRVPVCKKCWPVTRWEATTHKTAAIKRTVACAWRFHRWPQTATGPHTSAAN